jgi:3-deoxy-D-manno-octulosonate 8-phosphate phosphatase (KDO 8-P phosphatase)
MGNSDLNLREASKPFQSKLEKIKLCVFDVDGILTDGRIFYAGEELGFNRYFHAHDGYGMKMLMRSGKIKVGIITGGDSLGVKMRFEGLGVNYLYMGNEDKRAALDEIIKDMGISLENVLYMGDEFFDLPLLTKVGFAATIPGASLEVKEGVDYISTREAGNGCAREVMDMVRYAQDITPEIAY